MRTAKGVGRMVGIHTLLQMIGGAVMNFALMGPVTAESGYMMNAAANSTRVSTAALFGFAVGALSLVVAILAWPIFRKYSEGLAIGFLALSVAGLAISAAESVAIMSMLSLSQQYTQAAGADEQLFQTLGKTVGAARALFV